MPEVIVVRHGRPHTERLETGVADPSLDEFGRWQASRVCAWLAHEPVDAVISSPKARAIETVEPLAGALGLDIGIIDDLDEIDRRASVYVPTDLWATEGSISSRRWPSIDGTTSGSIRLTSFGNGSKPYGTT